MASALNIIIVIIATIALSAIAWQDFRSRSVYWWWFPILAVAGFFVGMDRVGSAGIGSAGVFLFLRYLMINLGFLAVQMGALKVYFLVRRPGGSGLRPKDSGLIDQKIGAGDVLFFVAMAFFFSPLNFIVFFVGSMVLAMAVWLILRWGRGAIPLAGLQALFFMPCLFVSMIANYSLLNDGWLLQKLGG